MKKNYQKPQMVVVPIRMRKFLLGSERNVGGGKAEEMETVNGYWD